LLVHDEIDIALPVAHLGVGEAVPLVGQRPQRLHEQADALGLDRQLTGAGPEQRALDAEDVADVPTLERLVDRLAHALALQVDLDLPR
jgi:hypothetical protein